MKKKYRVRKNQDFQKIIKAKKFYSNKSFVVYYQKNETEKTQIGISVSKKIGNAVVRNKIKRQIRMMCIQSLQFNGSCRLIIMVRKQYLKQNFALNQAALKELISKIKKKTLEEKI